jgi:chromate reductase, NAD(P)H dehydrogenase (quinone)
VIGADVIDGELPVGQAHAAFSGEDTLADPDLGNALSELLAVLAARAGAAAEDQPQAA